jgi:hypothetical protein
MKSFLILVIYVSSSLFAAAADPIRLWQETLENERPFTIFPDEQDGRFEFLAVMSQGCRAGFRDSLTLLRPGRAASTFESTKVFHFEKLDYAFIDYETGPHYYRVYFGGKAAIALKDVMVADEIGVRTLNDATSSQAVLRLKSREAAEKVWQTMTEAIAHCKIRKNN